MRHHHHLPYWVGRDLVLIHDENYTTHTDHHMRYSIPAEPCPDAECGGVRWEHRLGVVEIREDA